VFIGYIIMQYIIDAKNKSVYKVFVSHNLIMEILTRDYSFNIAY